MPFKSKKPPDIRIKLALARLFLGREEGPEKPCWEPDPDNKPQIAACNSEANIIGYGGAAGGGKTDLLIGLGATQHTKSIIFRREYPQLIDIIQRAKDLTEASRIGFNGNDKKLTIAGGRSIEFGAMQNPGDWEKFKGRPHDGKFFDEATEILESQFRSTCAWCRTVDIKQRTRVVLTFNPPTNIQGMWVIRYFAAWLDPHHPNPAQPGELRWYGTVGGKEDIECDGPEPFEHEGEMIEPESRTFFPARLIDNKYLFRTDYGRKLNALHEPLRSQLLYGSFAASMMPDPWQVIPAAWVEAAMRRWRDRETLGLIPGGQRGAGPMTCIGVDVAHGGKDMTALARRHGDFIDRILKYAGAETPDGMSAARLVINAITDGAVCNVDVIGYGASCHERLVDKPPEGFGIQAQPINFSCRSEHYDKSGKLRMVNVRAEAYWRLREELDPDNGSTLALPPDTDLKNELCESMYEITTVGIKIEDKGDIKDRLRRSPDSADAIALTTLPNGIPYGAIVAAPLPAIQGAATMQTAVQPEPGKIPGALGR